MTPQRAIAVLTLPRHVPDLITKGESVVQAMTGNAAFPNPTPPLAAVSAALATLGAAETATKTRTKGTVEARNVQRTVVIGILHELKAYVQQRSDADAARAERIIASAAMSVKKPPAHTKQDFAAKPGPVSGSVLLVARAAAHRASYLWQWSADGGKTWQQAPKTLQARTTIVGLRPATSYLFRYRAVTRRGEGDWSQEITYVVQ